MSPPAEVQAYLKQLTARLQELLGADLLGVYAGGSLALGGYQPTTSDIDVSAVTQQGLPQELKARVIGSVRNNALPCPARGLEFILYSLPSLHARPDRPDFEVELNDGPRMLFAAHTGLHERPAEDGDFWYGLDLAILRQSGVVLEGPPPAEVVPPLPRLQVLALLIRSLDWHLERPELAGPNARLNALRSLYFVRHDHWVSKQTAASELGSPYANDVDLLALVREEVDEAYRQAATTE